MHIAKRIGLVTAAFLLVSLLIALALNVSALRLVGQPNNLEHLMSDSGVYSDIIPAALAQAQKDASGDTSTLFGNQVVVKAAAETFPPQLIENAANQAIDGIYHWLNGQVPEPDFKIDLSQAKTNFANAVGQQAAAGAAILPHCQITSLSSLSSLSITNPLAVSCLPPGVTPAEVGTAAKEQILNARGFVDNPVITAQDIAGSQPGQTIFQDQLKALPATYRLAKTAPYILVIVSLLLALAMFFLSASRLSALRNVGIVLVVGGLILLVLGVGLSKVSSRTFGSISIGNGLVQSDVQKLLAQATYQLAATIRLFSYGYLILGFMGIVTPLIVRRRRQKLAPAKVDKS